LVAAAEAAFVLPLGRPPFRANCASAIGSTICQSLPVFFLVPAVQQEKFRQPLQKKIPQRL